MTSRICCQYLTRLRTLLLVLALAAPVQAQDALTMVTDNPPAFSKFVQPLNDINITTGYPGTIRVYDGDGDLYVEKEVDKALNFKAGGALGTHLVTLTNENGQITEKLNFELTAETSLDEESGRYGELLTQLHWTMVSKYGNNQQTLWNGKIYSYFVRWLRDHVHALKGMKYFAHELKSGIDLYADSQREDGMIFDNIMPRTKEPNYWDIRFGYGDFIKTIENSTFEFKRIPAEADVEYLFIEGLYYTWKATGDDAWMAGLLENAIKALEYSTSDIYRWSEKYQLIKRGYTIDTWDFQSSFDVAVSGDPMKVFPEKTTFGIMFGDNTGMYASCMYLAEMLEYAGRAEKASGVRAFGEALKQRLDELSWTGTHYLHHVTEDSSFQRDFGVDESKQVSLSNAYSLNRGLTQEQAEAIIKTYQRIREEMPETSAGEWFTIYPPFKRGFGAHNTEWEYMNGGVTSIVAGELAHGAFEHGFEEYAVSILDRIHGLASEYDNYLECVYRGAEAEAPEADYVQLDLTGEANVDLHGDGAEGVPGWSGQGDNDLRNMPTGQYQFEQVPFTIIDPADNGRRAVIGLSRDEGYADAVTIDVGEEAESIYFLHTLANTPDGGPHAGKVTLKYADGTTYTRYISRGQVGDWWFPQSPGRNKSIPVCKVAWRGENAHSPNIGVFAYGMQNPNPEKKIESMTLEAAANRNQWMVLALTLSSAEPFFDPGKVSYGIPDSWGAGAVTYALVEGLVGVKDQGTAYGETLLAPRWTAAGVNNASTVIRYPASDGYAAYDFSFDETAKTITLQFTGSGDTFTVRTLLPDGLSASNALLDGAEVEMTETELRDSRYAEVKVNEPGLHTVVIELQ